MLGSRSPRRWGERVRPSPSRRGRSPPPLGTGRRPICAALAFDPASKSGSELSSWPAYPRHGLARRCHQPSAPSPDHSRPGEPTPDAAHGPFRTFRIMANSSRPNPATWPLNGGNPRLYRSHSVRELFAPRYVTFPPQTWRCPRAPPFCFRPADSRLRSSMEAAS